MIANKTILYPRLVFAQMSYAYSYFRSNVLKFRRSNVLYFGAQTSFFFRSNVLSMRSNVHCRPGLCQSYIVAIPTCLYFVTEKTEINFLQIEVKNTNVPFNIWNVEDKIALYLKLLTNIWNLNLYTMWCTAFHFIIGNDPYLTEKKYS